MSDQTSGPLCDIGFVLPLDHSHDPLVAIEVARRAERVGLATVSCGELASYDAHTLLGALAVATEGIGLESSVLSLLARANSLIAMGAMAVSQLSAGRYVLGLGVGSDVIGTWHDRPLESPLVAMRRAILEIRDLFAGKKVERLGGFRLHGELDPVPVHIAALNPRMLALAGELADGAIFTFSGADEVAAMSANVRDSASSFGRPQPRIAATNWIYSSDNEEVGRQLVRETIVPYFGVGSYRRLANTLAGEETVTRIGEELRDHGRKVAARLIDDEIVDKVSVPSRRDVVAARVASFSRVGVDNVRFVPVQATSSSSDLMNLVGVLGQVARGSQ